MTQTLQPPPHSVGTVQASRNVTQKFKLWSYYIQYSITVLRVQALGMCVEAQLIARNMLAALF